MIFKRVQQKKERMSQTCYDPTKILQNSTKSLQRAYKDPTKIYKDLQRAYKDPAKIYKDPAKIYKEPTTILQRYYEDNLPRHCYLQVEPLLFDRCNMHSALGSPVLTPHRKVLEFFTTLHVVFVCF